MKAIVLIMAIFAYAGGCTSGPKPGSSLDDVEFAVFPHIIQRDGKYFLEYQVKPEAGTLPLVRVVYAEAVEDKAYYFFSTPISHTEKGNVVRRSLDEDNFSEFAERDQVYWLNKDKSEVKLKINIEK